MKKLMMIVSSMAVACTVQAASMVWGFGNAEIQDINGDYIGDAIQATAYLYLGTVTASENAFDLSGATFVAQGGQNADYTFGTSEPADNANVSSTAAGQAYSLILVEDNGKSLANYEGNYILVNAESAQGVDPMSGATWAQFTDFSEYTASDWQTMTAGSSPTPDPSGVPEPTSGLLMLVGLAGLALRRRRA